MASAPSSSSGLHLPDSARELVKILIAGPFGVGKTTLIDSVSEIRPLHTEEQLSEASVAVDSLAGVRDKTTTTVAIDFGRISLTGGIVLYLFGTPGQERFRSLWSDIAYGALGALVLVDTRRIDDSFEVLSLVEDAGLPYAVALNTFPDARQYTEEQLRASLDLEPDTPMVVCDARDAHASIDALIALVQHMLTRMTRLPEQGGAVPDAGDPVPDQVPHQVPRPLPAPPPGPLPDPAAEWAPAKGPGKGPGPYPDAGPVPGTGTDTGAGAWFR